MSVPRFFAARDAVLTAGARVDLDETERAHVRARRINAGDEVEVLDGRGLVGLGTLRDDRNTVALLDVTRGRCEPAHAVTVLLAMSEPARVEWALEKGTECGAAAFVLYPAARSQPAAMKALATRRDRLRKVVAEAVKQCGRSVVPSLNLFPSLGAALDGRRDALLVASPAGENPPTFATRDTALVIGPEGGLTEEEERDLVRRGALAVSLGPRLLRLETAVVAGLIQLVKS